MKILQINGVIHQGSTGEIVDSINLFLDKKGIEYEVCYGIGKKESSGYKFCYRYEQAFYRRISKLTGFRYGFAPISTYKVLKYIKKYDPDIVHLHSINGNCVNIYKLIMYLKKIIYILLLQIMQSFFILEIAHQHMVACNIKLVAKYAHIRNGQLIMLFFQTQINRGIK